MLKTISVPNIGDLAEVEVIALAVQPGDTVQREDPLITLESDKAAMDIPSPAAGTVRRLRVQVGERVSAGSAILDMELDMEPELTEHEAAEHQPGGAGRLSAYRNTAQAPAKPASSPAAHNPAPQQAASGTAPHAGPAVRKLARQLGVNLTRVHGSGPRQRILKEDIHRHVRARLGEVSEAVDFSQYGDIETVALSKTERLSGQHTAHAWRSIPHVTQFDQADITVLEAARQRVKEQYAAQGCKLTLLAFVVKAVVAALQALPRFNSALDATGTQLIRKHYWHIGIAVETAHGLVVPVIHDAERKSLGDIAGEIASLADRARQRKLAPAELQGGCFTVSNLGHIGGTAFTPIINAPEVAILGLSPARWQAVYNGEDFQPRLMLPLSLSYDHRVIDGAQAARFTHQLADSLGDQRLIEALISAE